MSDLQCIATSDAPSAIGPYSQAVAYGGIVYCSGQISLIPETGELLEGGVEEQTEQVLRNLAAVLKAAGSSLDRAIKCTVYVKSMDDFARVNEIYAKHVSTENPPARACVEVARLPKDVLVEIDCIAAQ